MRKTIKAHAVQSKTPFEIKLWQVESVLIDARLITNPAIQKDGHVWPIGRSPDEGARTSGLSMGNVEIGSRAHRVLSIRSVNLIQLGHAATPTGSHIYTRDDGVSQTYIIVGTGRSAFEPAIALQALVSVGVISARTRCPLLPPTPSSLVTITHESKAGNDPIGHAD